jgi:hypothetical protein
VPWAKAVESCEFSAESRNSAVRRCLI